MYRASARFLISFVPLIAAVALVAPLLAPATTFASLDDASAYGRAKADNLSQEELANLNTKVFSEAWLTARIIGYDKTEIDQMKAEVRQLKEENTRLRASIEGFNGTLTLIVNMLTTLLAKLR